MALPEPPVSPHPDSSPATGFVERVLSGLDAAERRRSRREARRLGAALLLIGAGIGLILFAAIPFRGAGVGTRTTVLWLARALVALNTMGHAEDALLARLQLAALPVGVTGMVLACCLVGVWRLGAYTRQRGRRPRRRTFVALFALVALALALALLTPLRAWQTGALRWGATRFGDANVGAVLVVDGNAEAPVGLNGGLSVIFGNATVGGVVQGDVVTVLGNVDLQPGAQIEGAVVAVGGRVFHLSGSQVLGDVVGSAPLLAQPPRSAEARVRLAIAAWIGLLLLGVTLSALFPWPMLLVAATARRFTWQSLLTAGGAGIGLLLVVVPLALSVAGLPIAVALLLVTSLAWAFGLVAVGVALGRRLLRPFGREHATLPAAVCGLGLLGAIAAIPIAGPVLIVAAGLLGGGAAVISALDSDTAETALAGDLGA